MGMRMGVGGRGVDGTGGRGKIPRPALRGMSMERGQGSSKRVGLKWRVNEARGIYLR